MNLPSDQLGSQPWGLLELAPDLLLGDAVQQYKERISERGRLYAASEKQEIAKAKKRLSPEGRSMYNFLKGAPGSDSGDTQKLPPIIKLAENPYLDNNKPLAERRTNPFAFPGAIILERHDMLHCLMGLGSRPSEEAFLLGFTAGTSSLKPDNPDIQVFKNLIREVYPNGYRINGSMEKAFDLGFETAQAGFQLTNVWKERIDSWQKNNPDAQLPIYIKSRDGITYIIPDKIYDFPLEKYSNETLKMLRAIVGIDIESLKITYSWEQKMISSGNDPLREHIQK